MLRRVVATQFDRPVRSGKTRPLFLTCIDEIPLDPQVTEERRQPPEGDAVTTTGGVCDAGTDVAPDEFKWKCE